MHRLSLQITSDPAELAPTRHKVEAFCAAAGFGPKAIADVGLCVNEALANITRHAYQGATDRPVRIDAGFDDGQLRIAIRDWGNGYDPSHVAAKTDPLVPGGLGMVCLRSLMDEISFKRQADGMLLELTKKL